jgi:hypothetical protein
MWWRYASTNAVYAAMLGKEIARRAWRGEFPGRDGHTAQHQ